MKGIRKLAEQLNVSTCTVSRALNDHPGVSEKTRKRVQQAALDFGYVPNQAGRSLRKGVTNTVGFMMESGGTSTENLDNYDNFFVGVVDGIKSAFARHKLDLILLPCSVDDDPNEYLQRIVSRGLVDAVILSATMYRDPRIDLLTRARIPFVALGRSGPTPKHTWIDLDFEGVSGGSIDRLVAHGHRRIAITLPSNAINLGYLFLEGYKKALARHGIAFDPALVFRAHSAENGGAEVANHILAMENRPTAVLLHYELMAFGLYRRLTEAGVKPGRDIAVIGFREGPASRFLSPTLTCHRMSLRGLGLATGEALLAQIPAFADFYPDGARNTIWPLEMVPGESDDFHLVT